MLSEKPTGGPFKAFNPNLNRWYTLPPSLIPVCSEDGIWQGFACVALGHKIVLMGGMHKGFDKTTGKYTAGMFTICLIYPVSID